MTEADRQTWTDRTLMLDFLRDHASERKLGLFACACCREPAVWHFASKHSRNVVEVAERFSDGRATREELAAAVAVAPEGRILGGPCNAWFKVHLSTQGQVDRAALSTAIGSAWEAAWAAGRLLVNLVDWRRQCDLLRDLFGNSI